MHDFQTIHVEGLLLMLIVGIVAGWLAHLIAGGRGSLVGNLIVGLLGSVVGGFLANYFGIAFYGIGGAIIVSTIGALLLLAVFGLVRRNA